MRKTLLACCLLTAVVGAQQFTTSGGGSFVDISPGGNNLGTAITGVTDDSLHNIVTTLGNPLFPAGNVRIGNNGFALSHGPGAVTTFATASLTNAAIAATGLPVGVTAGTPAAVGYLMPYWDDLDPIGTTSGATTLYWWEDLIGGILYIQWNNDGHFGDVAGQVITFQIQVVNGPLTPCVPAIRYAYLDTVFGGTQAALDNGLSATVGYVAGAGPGANAQWSFNTASVSSGMVLSITPGTFTLVASSPCGPGDLQLNINNGPCGGTYILAVTLNAGLFPNGWLYGVDIPYPELVSEYNQGFPFVGTLDAAGNFQIGPFGCGALPTGLTIYAVVLAYPNGGNGVITAHTPAISYTI